MPSRSSNAPPKAKRTSKTRHPKRKPMSKAQSLALATEARRKQTRYQGAITDQQVETMAWLSFTDEQMWKRLGISSATFYRWMEANPSMREARTRGGESFTAEQVKALHAAGLGYSHEAVHFTKMKDPTTGQDYVHEQYYTKHYPPNVAAIELILTNRAPDQWRKKQDVTLDINVITRRALLELSDD